MGTSVFYHRSTGVFAFLTALSYWAIGATHFLMPKAQLHFASGISAEFFTSLANTSEAFQIHYWSFAILSILLLAVILGLKNILRTEKSLWLRFTEALAIIGCAVTALNFILMKNYALRMANQFQTLDTSAQETILSIGLPHLDPEGLFGSCFLGLWLGTVILFLYKVNLIPAGMAILGLVGALLYELTFLGSLFHVPLLIDVSVGVGGVIIAPILLIWLGVRLISIAPGTPAADLKSP
jgi:hypothetical protein